MHLLHSTTWQQIFAGWRDREANNPSWVECATKIKGWPDWESWRQFSASLFKANSRNWQIFQFDNPMEEIPGMLVGPYNGWQNRHPKTLNFTFSELLEIPTEFAY